ncbi:hypothetical protein Vretimale_11332, partial [Volvox reticuliferus]
AAQPPSLERTWGHGSIDTSKKAEATPGHRPAPVSVPSDRLNQTGSRPTQRLRIHPVQQQSRDRGNLELGSSSCLPRLVFGPRLDQSPASRVHLSPLQPPQPPLLLPLPPLPSSPAAPG